ncbi:hypothetical protein [Teredinibacter sp. KSP-S5-2]|uniref:hypothetical protein n=1 Tax=Teredinibacter sp. KSP-S5-2 TaxID=3034506 RepID=UPI00293431BD|nr:hypothetical protein [Teredinibacter sp. KSP-S5-2]WNO08488.1 hypothetical protein P5V12_16070 [Teredinibacter sp. KSP-S5-2]
MNKKQLFILPLLLFSLATQAEDDQWSDSEGGSDWGNEKWGEESWNESSSTPLFTGFVEAGYSGWINDSVNHSDRPLEEIRWRLERADNFNGFKTTVYSDITYDGVTDKTEIKLREFNLQFSLTDSIDTKLGRQILTWGTGDLIFINDLFPKDWQSFFNGRDDEYLKAPSDAAKVSFYSPGFNWDWIVTPEFDKDNFLSGERFSSYSPQTQSIAQPESPFSSDTSTDNDYEVSTRIFGIKGSKEWAIYGYRGFYKTPDSVSEANTPMHSRMNALGASLRMPLGKGLWNIETGYYQSVEDENGDNPRVPNDEIRLLTGYEMEIVKNLTAAAQFYLEKTQDYQQQQQHSYAPVQERSEYYEMLTLRLTHLAMRQNLTSSLFIFYSPDEEDGHLRLKAEYRINDNWKIAAGSNVFFGEKDYTFWGQLDENDNLWMRIRYSY